PRASLAGLLPCLYRPAANAPVARSRHLSCHAPSYRPKSTLHKASSLESAMLLIRCRPRLHPPDGEAFSMQGEEPSNRLVEHPHKEGLQVSLASGGFVR